MAATRVAGIVAAGRSLGLHRKLWSRNLDRSRSCTLIPGLVNRAHRIAVLLTAPHLLVAESGSFHIIGEELIVPEYPIALGVRFGTSFPRKFDRAEPRNGGQTRGSSGREDVFRGCGSLAAREAFRTFR